MKRKHGTTRWMIAAAALLVGTGAQGAHALTLELSAEATLRPQGTAVNLSTTRRTVLLSDESSSLQAIARAQFATPAERQAFPRLVLQRHDGASNAWIDIYTFYRDMPGRDTPPAEKAEPPDKRVIVGPADPRRLPEGATLDKTPPPSAGLVPTANPPRVFSTQSLSPLPIGTTALRARAIRDKGAAVESAPLLLAVREAPKVLTLLAMGGSCHDPDANSNHQNLAEAGIRRNEEVCRIRGAQPTYLIGDLTESPNNINCNNPCNPNCMNFLEHLALRILNAGLADRFDSIDNPGQNFCEARRNTSGLRNQIVFGKWRNTEQEVVCGTPIQFNDIIDRFVKDGGKSLILVGQSQGGAKFAGMVRDHWRWGNDLTLELIVLWDATSFDVISFSGHHNVDSMGVRRVGSRPRHTVSFFQYSDLVPFQNGAPLLDPAEQYDLDGCFSHNGIARSEFVHQKTFEAVKRALEILRNRAADR